MVLIPANSKGISELGRAARNWAAKAGKGKLFKCLILRGKTLLGFRFEGKYTLAQKKQRDVTSQIGSADH